ncbi:MAG: helix-turn-helix transcriptional regulator [Kutzneria sp.]|nr:helix-turn-helix transcriptional regulator [Kutzneria sp.]
MASAERLFRERGFAATTVRQIAADAQVSAGSVMAVGDKDALLVAIFDGWIAGVHSGRSADRDAAGPPLVPAAAVQQVVDLLRPFIEYFALDRELSREYAAIVVRGAHESAIFQDIALVLIDEFNAVLSRTGLTHADANQGARVLYFAYLGILMSAGNGAVDDPIVVDRIREATQFIVTHKGE